ncbi:hypothetical protein IC229_03115 [Spirosoma sp. BT702]|uniref:Glycerophosphoryl diester phosphodiesterase membrane domain-containing protein n=1 Tax=Spirosoma profusum TaxID=2771354 RepID=A0A927AT94_9BACT|nr:hypothetical protein [Spirosoma profusum]MBD2699612.1 hypothetical protein [Spirosoma profusum]
MIQLFQQRDFGDKINVTFQYVSQNFKSLALCLLYIVGPVALIAGIASGVMQSNIFSLGKMTQDGDSDDPTNVFRAFQTIFSPAFGLTILFSALAILAVSLVTYAHMKIYARKTSPEAPQPLGGTVDISVAEVWEEVQPVIGRAIVIGILSSIIAGVATLFLIIPGIYVAIVLSLALVVTSFEGTDFGQTWNRCFALIRDKWWSTFGLLFVMGIISGVIGLLFTMPAGIIGFLIGMKLLPAGGSIFLILGSVVSTVGSTLLRVLIYVALGFQYTNLVERQEGRGLISSIDSIGTTPSQPRATDEGEY